MPQAEFLSRLGNRTPAAAAMPLAAGRSMTIIRGMVAAADD
jgi:hypothetical protein